MIRTVLTALAALTIASPALAEAWDFILINGTGQAIRKVEISAAGSGGWTENKFDPDSDTKGSVKAGGKTTVNFDKGSGCKYDIRATFADGATAIWTGFNVCDNSVVTLKYADGKATFSS